MAKDRLSHYNKPKNILILGAGIGGLYCAYKLGMKGFDVTLLEAKKQEELGYPWYDAVNKDTFRNADIILPRDVCIPKQVLDFMGPTGYGHIKQADKKAKSLDVDRKKLAHTLSTLASLYATVHFNTKVDELIIKDNFVIGAKCGSNSYIADLTIDSAGLNSPFKQQTPIHFLMKDSFLDDDFMVAYRAFIKKKSSKEQPSNVYIMPHGIKGISWCKDAPDSNYADVFVGKLSTLSQDTINEEINTIKEKQNYLTDEKLFEIRDTIPLRSPIGMMVGDGYAVIGNSASMSRPTNGSGIETTLIAAKILVDVISKNKNYSANNLWEYQYDFMKEIGKDLFFNYTLRLFLEEIANEDLEWIFSSGIINDNLISLANKEWSKINDFKFSDITNSYDLIKSRKDLIDKLETAVKRAIEGRILANKIPKKYDYTAILRWKEEYDAFTKETKRIAKDIM